MANQHRECRRRITSCSCSVPLRRSAINVLLQPFVHDVDHESTRGPGARPLSLAVFPRATGSPRADIRQRTTVPRLSSLSIAAPLLHCPLPLQTVARYDVPQAQPQHILYQLYNAPLGAQCSALGARHRTGVKQRIPSTCRVELQPTWPLGFRHSRGSVLSDARQSVLEYYFMHKLLIPVPVLAVHVFVDRPVYCTCTTYTCTGYADQPVCSNTCHESRSASKICCART